MPFNEMFDSTKNKANADFALDWKHDKFLWLMVIATALLLRPVGLSFEGVQNYAYLHSVIFDRDLDFTNQYKPYLDNTHWYSGQELATDVATGLPVNRQTISPAVMWGPFLLPVFAVEELLGQTTSRGMSAYSFIAVSVATGFYGIIGLALVYVALSKLLSLGAARFATALIWLASPLFHYIHFDTGTEHALGFFLFSIVLSFVLMKNRGWKICVIYGFSVGLVVTMRTGYVLVMVPLLLLESARFFQGGWKADRARFMRAIAAFLGFLAPIFLQMVAWKTLHGTDWLAAISENSGTGFNLSRPDYLTEVLFSSHHGLFYWHPLLLLGFAGLFAPRADVQYKTFALMLFIAAWWWVGSMTQWWAGVSFGQRMFTVVLPSFALGAGYLYFYYPKFQRVLMVLLALGILWNLGLIYQFETNGISRRDPVTWRDMLP